MIKNVLSSIILIFFSALISLAQAPGWSRISDVPSGLGYRLIKPDVAILYEADFGLLKAQLQAAPMENTGHGITFLLPTPEGIFEAYEVWEYHMMEEGLRNQFPEIGTYLGRSLETPSRLVRIDHTYQGFHARVVGPGGTWHIDPLIHLNTVYYQTYYKNDLTNIKPFECGTHEVEIPKETDYSEKTILQNGTQLKMYRFAVAATGEYTAFHGGTVPLAQSAQVTTMNRVNGVYERDFSVRMNIIANNNLIIYTNGVTDPYTNGTPATMLNENQTNLTSVIGGANYDIGHVFGTNSGGIASLGSVCSNTNKARGVTGSAAPINDPFDIDYVAHEVGHQFGGSHTFNSSLGSCNGNRSSSNAFEPGSGITVMAYAGICDADDLAPNSIDIFHARSYDQIRTFITTGTGNNCDIASATGNSVPLVDAGPSIYQIPLSTPFRLKATGSDANTGDQLTYCWEQYDLGNSIALSDNPTSGTHPLFMSFNPDTSSTRIFPRMATIVNNTNDDREKLPYYGRRLRFRVTIRDNRPNGGAASLDSTTIWASANTGPFLVTQPNAFLTWASNTSQTVTWNVAGSDAAPINCQTVNIKLSTDGGFTYPITLASGVPNNGSALISVPDLGSAPVTTCRVMVEAADNIFFDISNVNFTINQAPPEPPVAAFAIGGGNEICAGGSLNFTDQSTNAPSTWAWTFQGGLPSSSALQNPTNVQFSAPGTYTISLTVSNSGGSNSTSQTVTVNPLPESTITVNPSFSGQSTGSATLIPSGGEAPYTITWAVNPPQSGSNAVNLAPGDYVVTVTDNNGCFSAFNFTILGNAGTSELDAFPMALYPNPVDETLNLQVPAGEYCYALIDAAGRTVLFGQFSGETYTIQTDHLSAGLFTITLNGNQGRVVRKILKAYN